MGNSKKRLNIDGIIKILESHNITTDDLKKLNELQIIKQKNLDIIKLLTKLESGFKSKKIKFVTAEETQEKILKILNDIVLATKKNNKKNKEQQNLENNINS